jgi:NAD(P)-dependent dehydrogenase (short-subunit alcohol dehydrogenase family)
MNAEESRSRPRESASHPKERDDTARGRLALVLGASRGLGLALVARLLADGRYSQVYATCREPERATALASLAKERDGLVVLALDVTKPETIAAAARDVAAQSSHLDLLINCAGVLHDEHGMQPEKRLSDVEPIAVMRSFQTNALGTLLVAREFQALLERSQDSRFAAISARVGSIGDNRKGGWYAYRASKAALNMLIRTLAIEWARLSRPIACFALHPGTVATDLSQPFRRNLPPGQAVAPSTAAVRLLATLHALPAARSGEFFAYDGSAIEW